MAFALSEIFVVSDQNSAIGQRLHPMSSYQDMLAKDAFDYYGTLIEDVTYHPSMGKYLNAFHNIAPICRDPVPPVCTHQPGRELRARSNAAVFGGSGAAEHGRQSHATMARCRRTTRASSPTRRRCSPVSPMAMRRPASAGTGANFYGGGSTDAGTSCRCVLRQRVFQQRQSADEARRQRRRRSRRRRH